MKLQLLIAVAFASFAYAQEGQNHTALGRVGHVGNGDDVLVADILITANPDEEKTVLVRALGPSLGVLGVTDALQDPILEIRDENGMLESNDDWKSNQEAAIASTGLAPTSGKESAVLIRLGAGNYTAIVRGNGRNQGMAMVEAYILK